MSLDQTTNFSPFASEICLPWKKSWVYGADKHIYNQYWVKHCMSDDFSDVHWKSYITQVFVFIFRLVGSPCTGRFCFSAQQGETSRASSLFSLSQPCWKSEPLIWSGFNAHCTCVYAALSRSSSSLQRMIASCFVAHREFKFQLLGSHRLVAGKRQSGPERLR